VSPQGVKPDPTVSLIVAVNLEVTCLLIADVRSREGIPCCCGFLSRLMSAERFQGKIFQYVFTSVH